MLLQKKLLIILSRDNLQVSTSEGCGGTVKASRRGLTQFRPYAGSGPFAASTAQPSACYQVRAGISTLLVLPLNGKEQALSLSRTTSVNHSQEI